MGVVIVPSLRGDSEGAQGPEAVCVWGVQRLYLVAGVSGGGRIWLEQVPFTTVGHCPCGKQWTGVEAAAKKGEKYLRLPVKQMEFWAVLLGNWTGGPVRLRIAWLLCGSRGRSVLVL